MKLNEMMGGKEPSKKFKMLKRIGNLTIFTYPDSGEITKIQIQNKKGKTLINVDAEDFNDLNVIIKALNNEIK